jgi:hypothetical protein
VRALARTRWGRRDLLVDEEVQELIRLLKRPPPPPDPHPYAPVLITVPVPALLGPLIALGIACRRSELCQRQRPLQPAAAAAVRMVRRSFRDGGDGSVARAGGGTLALVEVFGVDRAGLTQVHEFGRAAHMPGCHVDLRRVAALQPAPTCRGSE